MPDAARIGRRPCIFVSAVSGELATAREIVGHSLRVYHNVDVIFQQEFGTESGDLIAMLRRQVDECDGVLQLIGDAYGAAPRVPPDDFDREISFTQFEFLHALQGTKKTWLIRVHGSCTRNVRAPEYVVPEERPGHSLRPEIETAYRARLERLRPGQALAATAKDDPALTLAIDEHNRRRTLQRRYAAGLHMHLEHRVKDDDELVQTIRKLTGLPSSLARAKGKIAGLKASIQQWDTLPANVSMGAFMGRAPLTFRVLSVLNPFGNQPAPSRRIVLHGLGGSGKTTLATEIGHVHNVLGHDVLMIKPVAGHDLKQDIAGLEEELGLPSSDAHDMPKWLQTYENWLMIVDGIDDGESAERVHEFCKRFQKGHYLITSCFEGYWKSVQHAQQFICYEVDVLDLDAAHRLLRGLLQGAHRSDPDDEVRELSRLLGGLPLAIQHAHGYLAQNVRRSIKAYIDDLETAPILPDAGAEDFAELPRPVAATWQASLKRMRPASRTLLRLLSFLTDHPIPLGFFQSPEVEGVFDRACATDPFEDAAAEIPRPQLAAAIRELSAYSFLRWYDPKAQTLTVHRLVLRMTQGSLRDASPQMLQQGLRFQHALASREGAIDGARKTFMAHAIRFVTDYLAREGVSARAAIYPHIFQLAALYRDQEMTVPPPVSPLPLAADELIFLGETSCLSGNDEDAVRHFARAAAMPQLTPYERARANQNLAYSLFGLDRIEEALERYSIAEEALNDQPADRRQDEVRYDLHSGRGWLLRFLGQLPAAIRDFERARAVTRQDDDGRMADIALGLGATYDYAGDYEAAKRHCQDAAARAETARDPHTQACVRYMMGWLLIRQGSLQEGMDSCAESMSLGEKYDFTN